MRTRALLTSALMAVSAFSVLLASDSLATHEDVFLENLVGVEEEPTELVIDESHVPNRIRITVQDNEINDGFLLVEKTWLESRIPYPAIREDAFEWAYRGESTFYRIPVEELVERNVVTIKNFSPETGARQFGYGSPDSIEFDERPMHVRVVEEPSDQNSHHMVLDFDDGDHDGQLIRYNAAWLESRGFSDPTFLDEDGTIVNAIRQGDHYLVEMPHFSISTIVDGIEISIDYPVKKTRISQSVPVTWHTNNGSVISHNEIHWGTSSNLLTNFVAGQAISYGTESCPSPSDGAIVTCLNYARNTSFAQIPASSTPTTRYYQVHSIIDLTSISTPVQQVQIVDPIQAPNPATNSQPANGATNVALSPTFSWSGSDPDGGTLKYELYLSAQNPPTRYAESLTSTSYQASNLAQGTTYYWRIRTIDPTGIESWGPTWSFTTTPMQDTAPFAAFTVSETPGTRTANFDASLSGDQDGEPLAYTWDFGDGTTGSGVTVSHTYTIDGAYAVSLTVTENGGTLPDLINTAHQGCLGINQFCIDPAQDDAQSRTDAPGSANCPDDQRYAFPGPHGGTPGVFTGTLSGLSNPRDLIDCYEFSKYQGATRVHVATVTESNAPVTFELCSSIDGCYASWTGTRGFSALVASNAIATFRVKVTLPDLEITTWDYTIKVATNRDLDRTSEEYMQQSYTDYEERFVKGTNYNHHDSDADEMKDGYEKFFEFLDFDPADRTDGDSDTHALDGIKNGNEAKFDPCGSHPQQYDLFVEIDYAGGTHTPNDGSGSHTHSLPAFADLVEMWYLGILQFGTYGPSGALHLSDTTNTVCGGTTTTADHAKFFDGSLTNLVNTYNSMAMDEHKGSWHWIFATHYKAGDVPNDDLKSLGLASLRGAMTAIFVGAMDESPPMTPERRLKTICQEVGHNFGIDHPLDNADQPSNPNDNNPTDVTCMYKGDFEHIDYSDESRANSDVCNQLESDFRNSQIDNQIEWKFVVRKMGEGVSSSPSACTKNGN